MEQTKEEFLRNNAQTQVTVEQLDDLMTWVQQPKTFKFSFVIHVIKLFAVFAYLYTRAKILDETWHISKNLHEVDQVKGNRKELESDNLS